jgi:EAL domain-containing protein (putative c-di-GMP-specific phosphodiesterase class I)
LSTSSTATPSALRGAAVTHASGGVENVEQLKIRGDLGCEQSQGYLHCPASRPRTWDYRFLCAPALP